MFHINLAGYTFTIINHYPYMEFLCRDYLTDIPGEVISVTHSEILSENRDGHNWPEAYLESLAIYRKISERLLDENILLFHCSALEIDGRAYLFTGPSGTGKSTHAALWRKYFGSRVVTINDDKPLLSVSEHSVIVHGTPYGGKEGLQTNTSAPVSAIVVLHQAAENSIRFMPFSEAYPVLLNQTYRRSDPEGKIKTMDLVAKLARLPVYSLGCTISMEAVELAYHCLTEIP